MTDGYSEGQRVYVQIDGERAEGIFVRPGTQAEGVTVESPVAEGPYLRDVGWVRRSDTGDVEPFVYERLSAV